MKLINTILGDVPGIESVKVNVVSRKAIVRHDPSEVSVDAIVELLNAAKLGAAVQESGVAPEKERFTLNPCEVALFVAECVAFAAAVGGFVLSGSAAAWPKWTALVVAVLASWPLVQGAAVALFRRRTIDMNVLMLISVGGAIGYGFYVPKDGTKSFLDGALVVVLFNAAEQLASYVSISVSNALSDAMHSAELQATLAATNAPIAVADIVVGTVVACRTGDRIPVDGVVVRGRALVDEGAVTGESLPRSVSSKASSVVVGGTVITNGYVEVKASAVARESAAARIADAVAEAQASASPTAQLVDTFAKYYTPAVVLGAAALFCWLRFHVHAPLRSSLMRSLTLVVAACPCALVMAAPIAVACTVASAARDLGVLIKSGASVEALASMRALCMDKTGTLTLGKFSVVARRAFGDDAPAAGAASGGARALRLAAAVEAKSRHPLAAAVVEECVGCITMAVEDADGDLNAGLPPLTARMVTTPGVGVSSTVDGHAVAVGSHRVLEASEEDVALAAPILAAWDAEALTPVIVTIDGRLALMLALADAPRATAPEAVRALQAGVGVDVVMLTGDRAAPAQATARALGLRGGCFAELLPNEKLARLASLRKERRGGVGMVGDGINDAPALAEGPFSFLLFAHVLFFCLLISFVCTFFILLFAHFLFLPKPTSASRWAPAWHSPRTPPTSYCSPTTCVRSPLR